MTRGRDTDLFGVAGGSAPHIPVLAAPVLELLQPRDGELYVDATFGAGGHTRLILAQADCRVMALDRDPTAVAASADLVSASGGRLTVVNSPFSALQQVLEQQSLRAVNGILLDLGVSSMQLDRPERGFSFRTDGPLDMRMGDAGPSAADVVAQASERDLATIIYTLGEERFSRGIARAIVRARAQVPITSTRALAEIVAAVVRHKPSEIHPATRTFQALRMFVNEELLELETALAAAERVLAPGGRLVVISFHSLEDRIVKRFLAARARPPAVSRHEPLAPAIPPTFRLLTSKPIVADAAEVLSNPRARSAKFRAAERTEAPARKFAAAPPVVPSVSTVLRAR
jgi:16S rRNA (cytosine1402-N4)-methyltransferase